MSSIENCWPLTETANGSGVEASIPTIEMLAAFKGGVTQKSSSSTRVATKVSSPTRHV
jgi:hypothetical protein